MKAHNQNHISHSSDQQIENEEETDPTLHTLNKVKLKPLLNYLWTDLEKVLVDMPCEFKADSQKKYRNGFLIITYGGVYIFKNKFLVSPPPTFLLTLLDCQTVTCDAKKSTITISFIEFDVIIKVKEAVKIINVMAKIVAECTYGLEQHLILPRFQFEKHKGESFNEALEKNKSKSAKKNKSKGQSESNSNASDNSVSNSPSSLKQSESSKSTKSENLTINIKEQSDNNNNSTSSNNSANNSSSNLRQNKEQSESNSANNSSSNLRQNKEQSESNSANNSSSNLRQNKEQSESNSANNSSSNHPKSKDKSESNSVNNNHSNLKRSQSMSVKLSSSVDKDSPNHKNSKEQSESNSANNSSLNQKRSKEQSEGNSTQSKNSSSNLKRSKTISNSSTRKSSTNEQNELKQDTFDVPNFPYSRSASNFFYCGSELTDDVFEPIHLSRMSPTRPKLALFHRSLFLAHFYNSYAKRLGTGCQYLAKYDENPIDMITIGPHFAPGKFSLPFGHAIGWETNLTKVMFYHFKPMYFGQLLESLLINSITIQQVCFVSYKYSDKTLNEIKQEAYKEPQNIFQKLRKKSKENILDEEESNDDDIEYDNESSSEEQMQDPKDYFDHFKYKSKDNKSHSKFPIYIPDFSFNKVKSTNVTSFWFHECDYPVIASFLEKLEDYVCPIDEFEITFCKLTPSQLEQVFKNMTVLACFHKLKTLAILKNIVKMFSIDIFNRFIIMMGNLEIIDISESELDGSQLFAALCTAHSPVKSVKLSSLKFHELENMSTLTIPPTLIHADFSKSSFSPQSFKDMLLLFTNKKKKEVMQNCNKVTVEMANSESAVMLCMANIKMKKEGYEVFNTLDFSSLSDNICEFDWSENKLPPNCVNSFFKFLETQKKMRILVMNNIKLEKQRYFFKRLTKYIMNQKLPGLDMRAKLYRKYGLTFYESLKKATFLRKLGVVIRNGSDELMNKFAELIRVLPMLTECKADGFLPHEKESLINLWANIINHPTICATDLPRIDFLYLENKRGIKVDDEEFINMLKELKNIRKPPSNMQQRTDFTLAQIRARNENIENNSLTIENESDFFVASCSTPWIDSTPHSRLENLQNSHNFEEQEMITPLMRSSNNNDDSPLDNNNNIENGEDSALLLNICNGNNNENQTYDMQCIPDDIESSGILPSVMPDYGPDENNQNVDENDETDEVEKAEEDEFDDQSIEIDETDSDNENEE